VGYTLWEAGKLNPYFSLYVAGYEVGDDLKRYVQQLSITHRYQESMTAKIVIRDEQLQWTDLSIFNKGMEWTIMLGAIDAFRPFGPFQVAGYKMAFNPQGFCQIDLDLMDKIRVLNKCARARSWEGKSIGTVVQQIAEENGLGFVIEDGDKFTFDDSSPAMQADWTDARFLRKIADRYGYYFAIQDGNIIFKQDQVNKDVTEPKLLAWRIGPKSLMNFEPAQATFIKKGGGTGAAGQPGANTSNPGVCIEDGEPYGTSDTDDEAGGADPNDADSTMDKVLGLLSGGAAEQSEAGDVLATSDSSEGDSESAVTTPPDEGFFTFEYQSGVQKVGNKTIVDSAFLLEHRGSGAPARDTGETPGEKTDVEKTKPAAAAGTKSDLALAKADLTVFDVTVRQGDPAEVVGVGTRFTGRWRIYEWEHSLDAGGLKTSLWVAKKGLGPSSKTAAAEDKAADANQDPAEREEEKEVFMIPFVDDSSGFVIEGDRGSWQTFASRKP
jgi:hypothetical protein